ncbi:S49 family peptidase [Roseococcus sp. DSY-14]|uniref:S49 family peptidase n=1 Tax=Roseococcus sp. DSY-14 TaxID=3369650 RepID=UPI00387B2EF2
MWIPFLRPRPPTVAVVRLEGAISARATPWGGGLNLAAAAPLLHRAFALKGLAAVFLAINSPGGSPVQSALVARRIRWHAEKAKVPVVAVCEDAAASGGYWIACAADEIVADPASILGSIGVVSSGFGAPEALARWGIERRLRTAGHEKALADPFLPETAQDRARLAELLDTLHAEFKDWVRQRRGPRLRAPEEELFTGRFWTGRQALALGLCDGLGDLKGEAERRFGPRARLVPLGARRRRFPFSLLPSAADAVAALEERAAWARLGL